MSRKFPTLVSLTRRWTKPCAARTPPEAVKIFREAYVRVFSDPVLLAERKIHVDPSSGIELEGLIRRVMDQPADVIARLKTLLAD